MTPQSQGVPLLAFRSPADSTAEATSSNSVLTKAGSKSRMKSKAKSKSSPREMGLQMTNLTYLYVRFAVRHDSLPPLEAAKHLTTLADFVIEKGKSYGATIYSTAFDSITMHWGTGKKTSVQAPAKAVAAAVAIVSFSDQPTPLPAPQLQAAVGTGKSLSGMIRTTSNSFFVVGGGDVPLVEQLGRQNFPSKVGAKVLLTQPVFNAVQFCWRCHPRLVVDGAIAWEPLWELVTEVGDTEWMYQLQRMDEQQKAKGVDPQELKAPFTAVAKAQYSRALFLIDELRGKPLTTNDVCAVDYLEALARRKLGV